MIIKIIKDAYEYFKASWPKFFRLPYLLTIFFALNFKLLGYYENLRLLVFVSAPFVAMPFYALVTSHLLKYNIIGQTPSSSVLPKIGKDDKSFIFHVFCLYLFYQLISALAALPAILIQISLVLNFKLAEADAKDCAMLIASVIAIIISCSFTVRRSLALVQSLCYGDIYSAQLVIASKKTLHGRNLKLAIITCAIYFILFIAPILLFWLSFAIFRSPLDFDLIIKNYWFIASDLILTTFIKYTQLVAIASFMASLYKNYKAQFEENLTKNISL